MNSPHRPKPQQITPEKLQEMLVEALMIGNKPLREAINSNTEQIVELKDAQRAMSQSLGAFLRELKDTLDGANTKEGSSGLEKQIYQLTLALNRFNDEQEQASKSQAQLLGSINNLSALLEEDRQHSAIEEY